MARLSIKLLPLAGVAVLLIAIGFFMMDSGRETVEELSNDKTVPKADFTSKKFKGTQLDSDKGTVWSFEADSGFSEKGEEGQTAVLEGFSIKLKQEDGPGLELRGNSAKYSSLKEEIEEIYVAGGIEGKTGSGYIFYAEHLKINLKEKSIRSDDVVTFVGPYFKTTGKGFIIDLKKETLKVLEDVISTFDKESLTI